MSLHTRHMVVPGYLALCLLLGGSVQAIWGNLLLQIAGVAILVWAALTRAPRASTADARYLGWLAAAGVTIILAQLIPLPPAIWTGLPGREPVAAGFGLLGEELPWLPWSLTPYQTLASALGLIPSLAVLLGILRLGAYRSAYLAAALILCTLAGVVLGALQVTTRSGYFYRFTTEGQAAGFFANANYMGTLLLATIPFLLALVARYRANARPADRRRAGLYGAAGGTLAVLLLGLALSRSMAAVLLAIPVLLASASLLVQPGYRTRLFLAGGAVALALFGCVLLAGTNVFARGDAAISLTTRQEIYARSGKLMWDMFPAGSGLGAFPRLYPRYEDPGLVDWVYVNHAHNDYLELVIEGGLPALLLLIALLGWWLRRAFLIWRSPTSGRFVRAATIASAAILAHSAVDFPARTAAIGAVLAACVALMAEPRRRRSLAQEGSQARPARHLSLE